MIVTPHRSPTPTAACLVPSTAARLPSSTTGSRAVHIVLGVAALAIVSPTTRLTGRGLACVTTHKLGPRRWKQSNTDQSVHSQIRTSQSTVKYGPVSPQSHTRHSLPHFHSQTVTSTPTTAFCKQQVICSLLQQCYPKIDTMRSRNGLRLYSTCSYSSLNWTGEATSKVIIYFFLLYIGWLSGPLKGDLTVSRTTHLPCRLLTGKPCYPLTGPGWGEGNAAGEGEGACSFSLQGPPLSLHVPPCQALGDRT